MNWYKKASLKVIIGEAASIGYRQIAYVDGPDIKHIHQIFDKQGEEDVISYMLENHKNEQSIGPRHLSGDEFIYERDNYVLAYDPAKGYASLMERVSAAQVEMEEEVVASLETDESRVGLE